MTESCSWFKMEADYFFQSKSFFLFFYNITMSGSLIFFSTVFFLYCRNPLFVCSTQLIGSLAERVEEHSQPPRGFYFEKFTSWKYTAPLQGRVKEFTDLSPVLLHRVHREERVCVSVGLSVCLCLSVCLSVKKQSSLK